MHRMQQGVIWIHFSISTFFYFYVSSLFFLSLIILKHQLKYTWRQIVKANADKNENIQLKKQQVDETGSFEDDISTMSWLGLNLVSPVRVLISLEKQSLTLALL